MKEKTENYDLELQTNNRISSGGLFKVTLALLIPILLYNFLNYAYTIYDTLMISLSGGGKVEVVVMLRQIKDTIATLGVSIIAGAVILISQRLGSKEYDKANTILNTTFYSLVGLSLFLLLVVAPLAPVILTILQTPTEIISSSTTYFIVQILCIVFEMFNTLFIGVQKVKGKTSVVFYLNIGVIVIKLGLSTFFTYSNTINSNETWLLFATLMAQMFLFVFALINLFKKDSILKVSRPKINKPALKQIIKVSLPLFVGSFVFSYSKVFINSKVANIYGVSVMAALGVVQIVIGFNNALTNAVATVSEPIMSQNYGAKNNARVAKSFMLANTISIIWSAIIFVIIAIFSNQIVGLLTGGGTVNSEMAVRLLNIQKYELLFTIIILNCSAFLKSMAKTKIIMLTNLIRTTIVRIPLLYLFVYVLKVNYATYAYILVISNAVAALSILGFTIHHLKKLKRGKQQNPQESLA